MPLHEEGSIALFCSQGIDPPMIDTQRDQADDHISLNRQKTGVVNKSHTFFTISIAP